MQKFSLSFGWKGISESVKLKFLQCIMVYEKKNINSFLTALIFFEDIFEKSEIIGGENLLKSTYCDMLISIFRSKKFGNGNAPQGKKVRAPGNVPGTRRLRPQKNIPTCAQLGLRKSSVFPFFFLARTKKRVC